MPSYHPEGKMPRKPIQLSLFGLFLCFLFLSSTSNQYSSILAKPILTEKALL